MTKIVIPKDYALIGLRFEKYIHDRVRLKSVAREFNFTTGTIVSNSITNDFSPSGRYVIIQTFVVTFRSII